MSINGHVSEEGFNMGAAESDDTEMRKEQIINFYRQNSQHKTFRKKKQILKKTATKSF